VALVVCHFRGNRCLTPGILMFLPGERSFDAFQQFRNRRAPRKRSFHQYNVPCRTHSSRNKRFRVDLERRSALVFCSSNAVVVLPVMICDMQYSSTSSRDALFALNNPRGGSCAMDDDDTVVRRARRVDFHVPGPRSAFPHCASECPETNTTSKEVALAARYSSKSVSMNFPNL